MRNETRRLYNSFVGHIAELNGVDDATTTFTVEPSVQQKLIDKQQESSELLKRINIIQVTEITGAVLGLSVSGRIAGRTNTKIAGHKRQTKDPSGLAGRTFLCVQTNFDTHLDYDKLDMWAKFPDFEVRIQNHLVEAQALDRICAGFNGITAALETNLELNPNLEDVNIGWLQKVRLEAPDQVMDERVAGSGKVTIGPDGDYATIDTLVYDAKETLLPTWALNDPELVAIVGRDILHDKYFRLMDVDAAPTEQVAREIIMATKRLGGLPAYRVPSFPAGTILITKFKNLSIYEQEGKRRRHIKDAPESNRTEDYQSSNDAYVIEDLDYICLIENVEYLEE